MKTLALPLLLLLITTCFLSCKTETVNSVTAFTTPFETSKGMETATYEQVIAFYIKLAKEFPEINIQTIGSTDSNKPLHIVTYNPEGDFNFKEHHGK
jgi:hypothetical protein